jgi:hypothetical protein
MSRQAKWREKKQVAGKCIRCGKLRDCGSTVYCYECLVKHREKQRARAGSLAWTGRSIHGKKSRGRPPYGKDSVNDG